MSGKEKASRGTKSEGQDPATSSTSATATTSAETGEQTAAEKPEGSEVPSPPVSEASSGYPLADIIFPRPSAMVKRSSPTCGARKVGELCGNFPSLIPPDKPALPEEMAFLEGIGIKFELKSLGAGCYGSVYRVTYTGPGKGGKEVTKNMAVKKIEISHPKERLDQSIHEVEDEMFREMHVSEFIMYNRHKNVTKHELIWFIVTGKTNIPYENPINHLIFMEECHGNLNDFVIKHFGYSTDDNYSGGASDFACKIWMRHVCQGLEFLHNADKKAGRTTSWLAIIHHDIKHANILYKLRYDRIKFLLCDFGLSEYQFLDSKLDRKQHQVMTNVTRGANRFLSNEARYLKQNSGNPAFQNYKIEGRKKDVFAVGLMLHDCLIGFADTMPKRYSMATDWLENKLLKGQIRDYLTSPLFGHVNPQCFKLMFQMVNLDASKRPLFQEVLEQSWLNDRRLNTEFVRYENELRREVAKRIPRSKM